MGTASEGFQTVCGKSDIREGSYLSTDVSAIGPHRMRIHFRKYPISAVDTPGHPDSRLKMLVRPCDSSCQSEKSSSGLYKMAKTVSRVFRGESGW